MPLLVAPPWKYLSTLKLPLQVAVELKAPMAAEPDPSDCKVKVPGLVLVTYAAKPVG